MRKESIQLEAPNVIEFKIGYSTGSMPTDQGSRPK